MIVWIVNPFDKLPGEGGRPGRYWTLAEVLSRRGHDVVWWSSSFSHGLKTRRKLKNTSDGPCLVRFINAKPYKRNVSFARIVNHRQFASRFYQVATEELRERPYLRPDRIVVSLPPISPANLAIKLRDEWGGKVIVDIQDAWPETFYRLIPGTGKVHDYLSKLILSPWHRQAQHAYMNADAITAVAQTYVDLSGASDREQPSCVVYLGAPFEQLDSSLRSDRKSVFPFTFVYLGSMSMNYDLETVLEAARLIMQANHSFRIVIVGRGPNEEKLKRRNKELSLESIIEFRGYLEYDQVVKVLGESHCALNTIMPESWCAMPNKVADYFGAGLPVINSIPGELAELIKTNDAGAYYHARDPESLAATMVEYIKHPEIAEKQGKNARAMAESGFRRETTYVKLAQFIEDL